MWQYNAAMQDDSRSSGMSAREPRSTTRAGLGTALALGLCLAFPSTSTLAKYAEKYCGPAAVPWVVALYVLGTLVGTVFLVRFAAPWAVSRVSRPATRALEIAMIAFLIVSFGI